MAIYYSDNTLKFHVYTFYQKQNTGKDIKWMDPIYFQAEKLGLFEVTNFEQKLNSAPQLM